MWHERIGFLLPNRWKFQWRYWRRQTPWDTQVTRRGDGIHRPDPARKSAGSWMRYGYQCHHPGPARMAGHGVDFIPKAISAARAKAARSGVAIEFLVANVTDLSALSGPFDYVLDIGCLHALKAEDRSRYATNLSRMLRPQACICSTPGCQGHGRGVVGISTEEVETLLREDFSKDGRRSEKRTATLLVVLVSAALRGGNFRGSLFRGYSGHRVFADRAR